MSLLTRQEKYPNVAEDATQDFSLSSQAKPSKLPEEINGRFRILKEIGRGGMAIVYLAEDLADGKKIALKLMNSQLTGTAKRRFTREFSTIASLKHPHLIEVYEYGESADGPFFAMEYFEGKTAAALRGQPLGVVLRAIHDLCEAIDFVHKKRIIHRDIKPANILVRSRPGDTNFEIRLSDFGLAKFANTSSSLSGDVNFLGTVAYCAPEQIMREELDQRADLYALGVVVYELVTGHHPFESHRKDIQSLITAQITTMPKGIAEIRDDISRELDRAVMRLLAKDPEQRPPSTAQLRTAIAQSLGWSDQANDSDSVADQENLTGRFVGRQEELAKAESLISKALTPNIDASDDSSMERILFVSGEAGIGKTSIVRRAARKALIVGGRVYDGRCFEGNIAPFQPFTEIIRQILSELEQVKRRVRTSSARDYLASTTFLQAGDSSTQISQIVDQYATDLLKVGPELRSLLATQAANSPHEIQRDSQYIFRSLATFFLEIARTQPICLILEDMHWADRSTVDLLRQIAGSLTHEISHARDGRELPTLAIYCTTRNGSEFEGELDWIPRLCEQKIASSIELRSIQPMEIAEHVCAVLQTPSQTIDPEIIDFVSINCFGNPFYISQTVREWRDYKAIEKIGGTWKFTVQPDSQSQIFTTMRQAVVERLQKLSEIARKVMGAASVIGANLDMNLLQEVCGDLSEFDFLDALDELLARKVFREGVEARHLQFGHDLYRESAGASLSKPRKERLHRIIAEAMEQRSKAGERFSAGQVGEHFVAAGERVRAFPYFMESVRQAIESQAFQDAKLILQRAEDCRHERLTKDELFEFELARGHVLHETGFSDAAMTAFKAAAELAENRLQLAQARFAIAKINSGGFGGEQAGEDLLWATLNIFGFRCPKTTLGKMAGASFYFTLVALVPEVLLKPQNYTSQEHEIIQQVFSELGITLLSRDVVTYAYVCNVACFTGLRSESPDAACVALSKYSVLPAISGTFLMWITSRAQKKSLQKFENIKSPAAKAYAATYIGGVLFCQGNLKESSAYILSALKYLERTRDWHQLSGLHVLRHLHSLRGDVLDAIAASKNEGQAAAAIGDVVVAQWAKYGEAESLARMGHLDHAIQLVNETVEALGQNLSRSIAQCEKARILLQASDYEGAEIAAHTGIKMMRSDLYLIEFPIHNFGLYVEALIGCDCFTPSQLRSKKVIRKAWWASLSARFFATQFRNTRAQTYRACGRVAAASGKKRKAEIWFHRAKLAAEQFENKFEYARSLIDWSLVHDAETSQATCEEGLAILDSLHTVLPKSEREIIQQRFGIACPELRE